MKANDFQEWLKTTPEYQTLVFQHGERLFIQRDGEFENLTVRLAYRVWGKQQVNIDQLNNMEQCYIQAKKELEELRGRLKTQKGESLAAILHGTCKCGEPWQSIISDREGFNLLHCFNCNNDRYENKEFFGDHEPKSMRGAND